MNKCRNAERREAQRFQLAAYIAVLKRIGAMKNEEEVKNVVSEEITAGDG
ncbi:hypothetical protein [Bacillus thuringiensis]|uniref:Uncharacterized protein n=1 Tax=Bacillus thuringiensis serovar toumanoffi TaxID=180862 RepID=A0ABD5I7J4_BACTU|nr:hypothetical protein [Bacillus thuringiensis]EEM93459.1 hypothetical protein bthur0013_50990 [Bacillus thuringiensis IBL 200]MCR6783149.1 hypothetical protein [Bacillus thuringiensis]MCR6861222.1 hypothetical protein [Bacillus thuringiensis]MCR6863558.1 hypothetical protein [Bacillus thuringiensis]MDW9213281.1 hypothetical protein [Bacillus thuringiensis serovar toumanoffi]